jgi:hypothetical protein
VTALTQKNIYFDKLLFDVDQINVSMLYHDEEDKKKVTSLSELEREMILAKCIEKIKEIAEMKFAFAACRRHSKLAESEVSDNKSPSSQRSRRSSNDTSNATATITNGNKIVNKGDGTTTTGAGGDAAGIIIDDVSPSNVQNDSMEICIGQMLFNDYGEVGRVVGIDPNGRPVLEVDDSDNSVVEVAEKISTNVHARETLDVVDLENTRTKNRDMQCCNH